MQYFIVSLRANHHNRGIINMNEQKKHSCCDQFNWEFIQDASHARACEFTLGKCTHCGSHIMHLFHTMGNHEHYVTIDTEFVEKIQSLEGSALKQFMKNWYDENN